MFVKIHHSAVTPNYNLGRLPGLCDLASVKVHGIDIKITRDQGAAGGSYRIITYWVYAASIEIIEMIDHPYKMVAGTYIGIGES